MLKRFFISTLGSLTAIWISVMLVIILGMMFAIGSITSTLTSTKTIVNVNPNSILYLKLENTIEERNSTSDIYSILNNEPQPQSLSNIVTAIQTAKNDNDIVGLYIACNGSTSGVATKEAIREAIIDFKESGKWVVAYGDMFSQGDYYVATAADEIYMNPVGMLDIHGMASGIPFFKGLLDKVGVDMQIVKVGTFKSAVEPYTLTHMSEANRLQTSIYLNSIWDGIVSSISESRGITPTEINLIADSLKTMEDATEIVNMKLVNGLKYSNEISDYLKKLTGTDEDDDLSLVNVTDYLNSGVEIAHQKSRNDKIAIYYAYGDITENGKDGIASDRVVPDILKLAENDDINAMVLRVNSGGGSAFASEQIWHALEYFKSKGKTLYVSMGDYAASGGYYISCGADQIFAQPFTLTGSIGIFGMIPCAKELITDKLGVNVDFVTTNANSAMSGIVEPLTPFQLKKLQQHVNRGYELFTERVATGRHTTQDSIKAIAEGRVWDGVTAHKIGLVDQLGSLTDAIQALAEAKGYLNYEVVEYPNMEASFWDIVSEIGYQAKAEMIEHELGAIYPLYKNVKEITQLDYIQARMETTIVE